MSRCWLVLASLLTFVPSTALAAEPTGCPYPATTDPAPSDRSDIIADSVTGDDALQTGRLAVTETTAAAPTCTSPDAAPAAIDLTSQFHYKSYSFGNYTGAAACVSVTVYHAGQGQPLQVGAYSPTFDPTTVNSNYLAAVHNDSLATYQLSFSVPANTDFEVVLNNAEPVGGAAANDSGAYQLLVGGCGEPGVDAGVSDAGAVTVSTTTSSDTVTNPSTGSGAGQSATPPATSGRSNTTLPANEGFGDCSATRGSSRDAGLIALAVGIAISGIRRRRRNDLR